MIWIITIILLLLFVLAKMYYKSSDKIPVWLQFAFFVLIIVFVVVMVY